jgi:hypothetical protein
MRADGLPRIAHDDTDCAGIQENGRATRFGHLPGPGGDARAVQRSAAKARARRHLKGRARAEGRAACCEVE